MTRRILLHSGVLGLVTHPRPVGESLACIGWLQTAIIAGSEIIISEVVYYETRRECLRRRSTLGLANLDDLIARLRFLPLTTPVWRRAAELWTMARNGGYLNAATTDLNIDLLLAAQAQLLAAPDSEVIIATSNVRHLAPFADARLWRAI